VEVVHPRGLAGEPMDRLFQRHHLLFAHPVTQQSGAVVIAVMRMRTRAAIAGPDHGIVRAEDLLLRLRIGAALDDLAQGAHSHVGIPWKMPFGFVKSSSCGTSSPSRRSKIGPCTQEVQEPYARAPALKASASHCRCSLCSSGFSIDCESRL